MPKFTKILFVFTFFTLILFPSIPALAQYGLNETAGAAGLANNAKYPSDVPTLLGNVIGTALSMISVIFFLLMVYGGFLWMTAHGDSGQVDKAKDTIIAAVIGILVVLASYAITTFIFSATSGAGNANPNNPPGAVGDAGGQNPNALCQAVGAGYDCRLNEQCDPEAINEDVPCPGGGDVVQCCLVKAE